MELSIHGFWRFEIAKRSVGTEGNENTERDEISRKVGAAAAAAASTHQGIISCGGNSWERFYFVAVLEFAEKKNRKNKFLLSFIKYLNRVIYCCLVERDGPFRQPESEREEGEFCNGRNKFKKWGKKAAKAAESAQVGTVECELFASF